MCRHLVPSSSPTTSEYWDHERAGTGWPTCSQRRQVQLLGLTFPARSRGLSPMRRGIVFAHFPLSFHAMARPAARAAQVAFEQGGSALFEAIHDRLFAAQKALSEGRIDAIASEVGVDMARLDAAKKNPKYDLLFRRDDRDGESAGVGGTRTVFINGRKYAPADGISTDGMGATIGKLLRKGSARVRPGALDRSEARRVMGLDRTGLCDAGFAVKFGRAGGGPGSASRARRGPCC